MRMSCNGCRVLRKACHDNCVIRPCLGWIHTPEAQGNATLFLAKFYGRAGLTNLLSARPQQQRAAIFKSLLYEACGRIVNPVYGSVGLLWSGKWHLCQAAVESVLKGAPITQLATATTRTMNVVAPMKASDIRHLANRKNHGAVDLHKVNARSRAEFKQPGLWSIRAETGEPGPLEGENLLVQSVEISNKSCIGQVEHVVIKQEQEAMTRDLGLDLTLGPKCKSGEDSFGSDESDQDTCHVELRLTVRG